MFPNFFEGLVIHHMGTDSFSESGPCPKPIGALIIRIGFWGPVYYNSNEEPPK